MEDNRSIAKKIRNSTKVTLLIGYPMQPVPAKVCGLETPIPIDWTPYHPLPDSITKGRELVTFHSSLHLLSVDQDDDELMRKPPASPRGRSHSLYEGERKFDRLQCSLNTHAGSVDSTDTICSLDSLPKPFGRSKRHIGRLNTQLMTAIKCCNALEVEKLLLAGASPNATCHSEFISACHIAALFNNDILSILLDHGAEGNRADRLGRTPLLLAAWAGHVKHVAALLGLPADLQKKLNHEVTTPEIEEEITELRCPTLKDLCDVKCELGGLDRNVPKQWRDNIDHCCKEIDLPFLQPGWTALHAAASTVRLHCCRVLMAAGAETCARDLVNRIPLDVVGCGCLLGNQTINRQSRQPLGSTTVNFNFTEVVKLLLKKTCRRRSFKESIMMDTILHTAVELENLEAIPLLLNAGFSARNLSRAGLTPLHLCVKKKLKSHLQAFICNSPSNDQERTRGIVNARDKDGYTVLHYAVLNNWGAGVCLALEACANIILPAENGETPIHTAAALGNIDILREILNSAKSYKVIDVLNQSGETALFKAIKHGHTDCVEMILQEESSIEITLPRRYNVFHVACELGNTHVLKVLLNHNYTFTRKNIDALTIDDRRGYGPVHFAVEYNHSECVKLLQSKHALINLKSGNGKHKGSTPLHIAARKNNTEIANMILKIDKSAVHNVDEMKRTPLHMAAYYGSRDLITLLLREGSSLSASTAGPDNFRRTAIQIIMNNLSKPTEFLESIFDMYIHDYRNADNEFFPQNIDAEVKVDYSILLAKNVIEGVEVEVSEMGVIAALLKTGNRREQRRLLIHPLVESFLCLKWKALLPFFYVTLLLHGIFVSTLTAFLMNEYFYKDTDSVNYKGLRAPVLMYLLYFSIAMIVVQEIILLSASLKHYMTQLETWVKLTCITLALIIPKIIQKYPTPPKEQSDWPRHIATTTIMLCWMNMTLLLSRFPSWGYYVLMFGKVSSNVIKILLTFVFLVIGFALCFVIQFHHHGPFESFFAALVKTMVMMTSEFDYDDLVDNKDTKDPAQMLQSLLMIRLIFLIFLILAAIVLMNLMVGVAVNDLHNLQVLGNIMRLEKQVEFLGSLEAWVFNRVFLRMLPAKLQYNLRFTNGLNSIVLKPCEPSWSYYKAIPKHVRDAIFEKAVMHKKYKCHQNSYESIKNQLCEIYESVKKSEVQKTESQSAKGQIYPETRAEARTALMRLTDTDMIVVRMKRQLDEIDTKMDMVIQLLINQHLRET